MQESVDTGVVAHLRASRAHFLARTCYAVSAVRAGLAAGAAVKVVGSELNALVGWRAGGVGSRAGALAHTLEAVLRSETLTTHFTTVVSVHIHVNARLGSGGPHVGASAVSLALAAAT